MMADELKPCAHCGSDAKHYHRPQDEWMSNTDWVCCENDACGVQTCMHETKEQAITAWNTRPTPSASEDEVDVSDGLVEEIALYSHDTEALPHAEVTGYGIVWDWEDVAPEVRERHLTVARAILPIIRRREQQAAEAMRERCAVEVTLYQGIGVSSSNYLTEEVANLIAEAIRSLTTEVGKGAQ